MDETLCLYTHILKGILIPISGDYEKCSDKRLCAVLSCHTFSNKLDKYLGV